MNICTCLLVLLIFDNAYGCPFLSALSLSRRGKTANHQFHLRRATSSATNATSHCKKTEYKSVVSTGRGICSAYVSIHSAIDYLLNTNTLQRSELFGSAVRLAFHDAGEVDIQVTNDLLGPDGCLASHGGSEGLVEPMVIANMYLEPIWQTMCDRISRADFNALFGTVAVERATDFAVDLTFQYGRRDNIECEAGEGRLPNAEGGLEELQRVFVNHMGLTMDDAVTLLGAHSLGHMHIDRSGYGFVDDKFLVEALNAWDDTPGVLDNDYYTQIIKQKWKSQFATVPRNLTQWRHVSDPLIMINPDIAIAYPCNTTLPPRGPPRQVCRPQRTAHNTTVYTCVNPTSTRPSPLTLPLVQAYAADNSLFLQAFGTAFAKMLAVGYGGVPRPAKDGAISSGKLGTLTVLDRRFCGSRR